MAATKSSRRSIRSRPNPGWDRGNRSGKSKKRVRAGGRGVQAGAVQRPRHDATCDYAKNCSILIEPVQGESGITIAKAEYLTGLRRLCETELLLLFDEVQPAISAPEIPKLAAHSRAGDGVSLPTYRMPFRCEVVGWGISDGRVLGARQIANVLSAGTHDRSAAPRWRRGCAEDF